MKRGREGGAQWGLGQVSKCFPPYPLLHRAELGGTNPEKVKLGVTANKTTHYLGQQSDTSQGGFWWAGRKTHHTDVPKGIRTPELQVRFPTRPPATVRLNTVNRKGENRMPSDALDTPKFLGWGDTTQVVNAPRGGHRLHAYPQGMGSTPWPGLKSGPIERLHTCPPVSLSRISFGHGRGANEVCADGSNRTPALLIYFRKESSRPSHMKAAASVLTDRCESAKTSSNWQGWGDHTTTAYIPNTP